MKVYETLMQKSERQDVNLSRQLRDAPGDLPDNGQLAARRHRRGVWKDKSVLPFDFEMKWIIQMYAGDLIKQFGTLSIVKKRLLSFGVMKMLRVKKVTWQVVQRPDNQFLEDELASSANTMDTKHRSAESRRQREVCFADASVASPEDENAGPATATPFSRTKAITAAPPTLFVGGSPGSSETNRGQSMQQTLPLDV